MLWFIELAGLGEVSKTNLNTSYVMVHHEKSFRNFYVCHQFKYILCYGSSFCGFFSIKTYNNLNTSYVMVHHEQQQLSDDEIIFKYILCYGSSINDSSAHILLVLFKYILCYGSSPENPPFLFCVKSIFPSK